jgi:hypothetical protein
LLTSHSMVTKATDAPPYTFRESDGPFDLGAQVRVLDEAAEGFIEAKDEFLANH